MSQVEEAPSNRNLLYERAASPGAGSARLGQASCGFISEQPRFLDHTNSRKDLELRLQPGPGSYDIEAMPGKIQQYYRDRRREMTASLTERTKQAPATARPLTTSPRRYQQSSKHLPGPREALASQRAASVGVGQVGPGTYCTDLKDIAKTASPGKEAKASSCFAQTTRRKPNQDIQAVLKTKVEALARNSIAVSV